MLTRSVILLLLISLTCGISFADDGYGRIKLPEQSQDYDVFADEESPEFEYPSHSF